MLNAKRQLPLASLSLVLLKVTILFVSIIFKYIINTLSEPIDLGVSVFLMILYGSIRLASSFFLSSEIYYFCSCCTTDFKTNHLKGF